MRELDVQHSKFLLVTVSRDFHSEHCQFLLLAMSCDWIRDIENFSLSYLAERRLISLALSSAPSFLHSSCRPVILTASVEFDCEHCEFSFLQ